MRARTTDLFFTLYGDYICHRGGEAWTRNLLQLLGDLDISAPAARSAIARLSQKGWLSPRKDGRRSLYAQTPNMAALLADANQRIYGLRGSDWDGDWYIINYSLGESRREKRNYLRKRLLALGLGQLSAGTWISPHDLRADLTRLIDDLGLHQEVGYFRSRFLGFSDEAALVAHCWDLQALNNAYQLFLADHQPHLERDQEAILNGQSKLSDRDCFVRRFCVVHDFRRFPYRDPHLPPHLLPADWLGATATRLFDTYQTLLTDRANRYVDAVLATTPISE